MRTTVTLVLKAERLLRKVMHEQGQTFKEALNQAVIRGLSDLLNETEHPVFSHILIQCSYEPVTIPSISILSETTWKQMHSSH